MKKVLGILVIAFLFSGCMMHDKTSIEFICIDGKVYANVYKSRMVNADDNIKNPSNLVTKNTLIESDDESIISCSK
jgi:PBP1b-binding outer membrane lipoprotein LpoB